MLKVKRLVPEAILPTIAHPGEDLAYDVYTSCGAVLDPHETTPVQTGIAIEFDRWLGYKMGGVLRTRSSWAKAGLQVVGGEIDAGYRGEIVVLIHNSTNVQRVVAKGERIAQLRPTPVLAGEVVEVNALSSSSRNVGGFGSTGK